MLKSFFKRIHPKYQALINEYPVDMKPRYGHGLPPHKQLYDIIDAERNTYRALIDAALSNQNEIAEIQDSSKVTDSKLPGWNNGFLPGLDIIAIYTMISYYKPKRYVEVGSGNSTKVAFKVKQEQHNSLEITSIDPMPRAEIDQLADVVIRKPFEDIDYQKVLNLEAGDILFIDNSHRILPNSDSMVFYMEIFPQLNKGVIVHIHDIYLPYDYPQFMCDRFYTEQYGLAMYVMANPKRYKTIFPCYFVSEDEELAKQLEPIWNLDNLKEVERHGGSYWLQIGE
ncbi:class I SAM-dependent methyltransferase [Saprospiraceae bacterium]|nr:class I SAM-dependent methyltransferase [Saprospiraceae bacterium]MDC1508167.1 class I SAM-dependent methyltransferase [Saprospiraceae bacterium]